MKKKKQLLPIDIALPVLTPLEGGALFVVLPTLHDLSNFWQEHQATLPYAAKGRVDGEEQNFLNEYEWVFGPTKESVVQNVFRWNQVGIACNWHDWASSCPDEHADFFTDRELARKESIENVSWTDDDEAEYQVDCLKRTPQTYRGWWELKNLPAGINSLDWFSTWVEEIIDPNLPINVVTQMLQVQTFDDWKKGDPGEIEFHDSISLDEEIAYWTEEKRTGQGYYGDENENLV
jgi:hypothetical protein